MNVKPLKIIAFVTSIIFSFNTLCWSAPRVSSSNSNSKTSYEIKIPKKFGKIVERWQNADALSVSRENILSAKQNSRATLELPVVIIQDAHCNFDAQVNEAKMLDILKKEYNYSSVFLEGAVGRVDTAIFSAYPNKRHKRKIFKQELKRGAITGADYYAIMAEEPVFMHGLENRDLYAANYKAALFLYAQRGALLKEIRNIKNNIAIVKNIVLDPKLKELDVLIETFNGKTGGAKEETIYELFEALAFYCVQYTIKLEHYPELKKMFTFLQAEKTNKNFSTEALLDETLQFAYQLRTMLTGTDEERELLQLSRQVTALEKGVCLSLSFSEAQWFLSQADEVQFENYERLCRSESLVLEANAAVVRQAIKHVVLFYQNVILRDDAMCTNLEKQLKNKSNTPAVVIAGGFHTDGFTAFLKEKNMPYTVICPAIKSCDPDNTLYFNHLNVQSAYLSTMQIMEQFDVSSSSLMKRAELIRQTHLRLKELFRLSRKKSWKEFIAWYRNELSAYLIHKMKLTEDDEHYLLSLSLFDRAVVEGTIERESEQNASKVQDQITTRETVDSKDTNAFDDESFTSILSRVLDGSGLRNSVIVKIESFQKNQKDRNIARFDRDTMQVSIHPEFMDDFEDIKKGNVKYTWQFPDGQKRTVSLSRALGYRIAMREMGWKNGGRLNRIGEEVFIEENPDEINRVGERYRLINEAAWLWYQYSYRNYKGNAWYHNQTFAEIIDTLFEKGNPSNYSQEKLFLMKRLHRIYDAAPLQDALGITLQKAKKLYGLNADDVYELLIASQFIQSAREFPTTLSNETFKDLVKELALAFNEDFFMIRRDRGELAIPHYTDDLPSDVHPDFINRVDEYKGIIFHGERFITRDTKGAHADKLAHFMNRSLKTIYKHIPREKLFFSDMQVLIVPTLHENAAKLPQNLVKNTFFLNNILLKHCF